MTFDNRWLFVGLSALAVNLAACGGSSSSPVDGRPDVAAQDGTPRDVAADSTAEADRAGLGDTSPPDTGTPVADAARDGSSDGSSDAFSDTAPDRADTGDVLVDALVGSDGSDARPDADAGADAGPADASVAPIMVRGTVRDPYGVGVPGYTILLVGPGRMTTSAADGTFMFADVVPPYTLAVRRPGTRIVIQIYDGLDAPVIVVPGVGGRETLADPLGLVGVAGYSTAKIVLPDATTVPWAFASSDPAYAGQRTVSESSTTTLMVGWRGSAPLVGALWSWLITCTPSTPDCASADLATSSRALTLMPGTTVAAAAQTMTTIAAHHSYGVNPSGIACTDTESFASMTYLLPGAVRPGSPTKLLPVGTWSLPDPPAGVTLRLDLTCKTATSVVQAQQPPIALGADTTFTLFAAPTQAAPADGATVAWPPTLSFAPSVGGSGIFLVGLYPESGGDDSITLYTTKTTAALPALGALGVSPPSGEHWVWSLNQDSAMRSVNAVVDGTPPPASSVRASLRTFRLIVVR